MVGLNGLTPTFARLAVTPEQIDRYALPSAPQKATDQRGDYMHQTVQAEALSPEQLADELRTAIEARVDLAVLNRVRESSLAEREQILDALDRLHDDD